MKLLNMKVMAVAASFLVLTACSTTHKTSTGEIAGGTDGSATATAGLGEGDGFAGGASSADKLKAPANQVYYFAFDKYAMMPEDYASIAAQAKYLVAHPHAQVKLEGNTDIRGSREYNIGLGWRRAKAVAALLEQYGALTSQIVMVSYGAEKPAVTGDDENAYRLNRRSNLTYTAY